MSTDLIYFVYVALAALVVATITLGGATLVYFSEERWGARRPDKVSGRER